MLVKTVQQIKRKAQKTFKLKCYVDSSELKQLKIEEI